MNEKNTVTEQGLMCPRHRKPNSDGRCLQQSQDLLQGAKQESGRQASDPLQIGLWVRDFLKGKNKEAGGSHRLVTFLRCSFGTQDACGLGVSGLVVHDRGHSGVGLLAHLAQEKQPESQYINSVIDNSSVIHLTLDV